MKFQKIVLAAIWISSSTIVGKTVYFGPGQWGDLFNIDDPVANADGHYMSMYYTKLILEKHGYTVKQANSFKNLTDFHCIIVFDIPVQQLNDLLAYPRKKCFAFLWEPPSVIPANYEPSYHSFFSHLYTWNDALLQNPQFSKFYYPVMNPMVTTLVPFELRKLCTLIAGNKYSYHAHELYSARKRAIEYFETQHCEDFDLYGKGWTSYKNYRGSIIKKIDVLTKYKFCICYENIKEIPGYITEKVFDCFRCGCVPIYWGAENVTDYIPANCFIDRRNFASEEELYQFMNNMDKTTHQQYLHNIQQFLQSPAAQLFSIDTFSQIMYSLVSSIEE